MVTSNKRQPLGFWVPTFNSMLPEIPANRRFTLGIRKPFWGFRDSGTLKPTASSHLKFHGWKTNYFSFGKVTFQGRAVKLQVGILKDMWLRVTYTFLVGWPIFRVKLLVSRRVVILSLFEKNLLVWDQNPGWLFYIGDFPIVWGLQ